ncbi:AraC family transcriptional regulator [Flavobacterium sp.]|uniref:AraC family transcriptional regulator n=1 Tax=Flavobacterium sp. TaxID=239 RepID=UPI00261CE637|nr:AraC family transcriptional regulator [Flavobacterium sp.]MDD3005612.1 AraC family transcriptional regulator [Flavobacterium sp.]
MKYYLQIILIISSTFSTKATNNFGRVLQKDYSYFENQILENKKDTAQALYWAEIWLKKAKTENNSPQQVKAYKIFMHWSEKKFRMIYADSLLSKAIETKNDAIIGNAYLTIGAAYYDNKEYIKALDNYIIANTHIVKTNDPYLIKKAQYTIAQTKYYLGYYEEAIALFTECIAFFKNENETAYIKSLHSVALCYNQLGRYDLSSFHNQLGIRTCKEFQNEEMLPYFINSEGINQYKLKKNDKAIQFLRESLKTIEQTNDFANQSITYFYLGKCYWELEEKEQSLKYLLKADEIMTLNNFIRPDLRENYELLIQYFKLKEDQTKQLFYINKLLVVDKTLTKDFKYIAYKIHKEYDTKSLLRAKEEIENQLTTNKKKYLYTITGLLFLITIMIGIHLKNKKRTQLKFQEIMQRLPENNPTPSPTVAVKINISQEVIDQILLNLKKFEKSKKFLEKDMSLVRMAFLLNTNTKYASLVIAEYRGKKLINYINDLKIDYIVEMLKTNKNFRNYTNKALAEEAGFGSTQIFTKAFTTRNHISPTSFIKELQKQNANVNL